MPAAYYLDTSALLPRLLRGAPGYAWVNMLCDPNQGNLIAIAEITEAEVVAALHQLARGGTLKRKRIETALALFWDQVDQGQYAVISISSVIVRQAAELCALHPLKGYDAIQLACALVFREDVREANRTLASASLADPIFLSEDQRLIDAALGERFVVDTPLGHP